ncbi:MAG: YhdH/YhfP family quinone oxidoreductase [Gammaproteobacteria bacterium]|nr:YhdH/YhfP family quinone oxidoreductase [Gammaproteobacteria bacterium]
MKNQSFKALQISETPENNFQSKIVTRSIMDLPDGEILIRVLYSSLNFKDALSASGNKGVTRSYPHTPGIDAAGIVVSSDVAAFSEGDEVIVTGYDLGMNTPGGFGEYIRVPSDWVVKRSSGLNLRDSMILGTAGVTAALCIEKLLNAGIQREHGEIIVTGATGGVGIISVAILSSLGFSVAASTGKISEKYFLESIGASRVIEREELAESSSRPLLREKWAGAIDVVGGTTLVNVLKSLKYGASVAACGLVESPSLEATVLPFILRGINLLGVDSVEQPRAVKQGVWEKLANDWKIEDLSAICTEITFDSLQDNLDKILAGKVTGRTLLNLDSS